MKYSIYGLVLLLALVFTSCDKLKKEEQDELTAKQEVLIKDVMDKDLENKDKCFDFVFPITLIMPDGTAASGNSAEELEAALKAWYEAHPDSRKKPEMQYPIEIIFGDKILEINSEEEMKEAFAYCKGDKEEDKCFKFVYPIAYTMPDGATVSGNNAEEVEAALKAWYEAHPDSQEKPALQFPVDLIFEDVDQPVTVNNEEELKAAYERCE